MAVSTLSVSGPNRPKIYRGGSQVGYELSYGANLEANSSTFTTSHFVYSNAGAITAADDTTGALGLACKAATEVTSGNIQIPVAVVLPGDLIMIRVEDGSGNLEASDTTCVVGKAYGLAAYTANTEARADSAEVTNEMLIYLGPVLDAAGDSSYWGWFAPDVSGAKWQSMEGS